MELAPASDRACASCTRRWTRSVSAWKISTRSVRGATRTGDTVIDPAGTLAQRRPASTAWPSCAQLLSTKRADDFRRCLAEKMLTYALGRGTEYYDRPAVEASSSRCAPTMTNSPPSFSPSPNSVPFQNRRAEAGLATNP